MTARSPSSAAVDEAAEIDAVTASEGIHALVVRLIERRRAVFFCGGTAILCNLIVDRALAVEVHSALGTMGSKGG